MKEIKMKENYGEKEYRTAKKGRGKKKGRKGKRGPVKRVKMRGGKVEQRVMMGNKRE